MKDSQSLCGENNANPICNRHGMLGHQEAPGSHSDKTEQRPVHQLLDYDGELIMMRWLFSFFKRKHVSEPVVDACHKIGAYFLAKFDGDYVKSIDHVYDLRIEKVEVSKDAVTITTSRPGLLIGRMGKDYEGLCGYLKIKIKIVESREESYTDLIVSSLCAAQNYELDMASRYEDYSEFH